MKSQKKKAWMYFYPEGNGNPKKSYCLHHKDPTLKYRDPIRYAEWRIEDLEMLGFSEHSRLHCLLRSKDPEFYRKVGESIHIACSSVEAKERRSKAQKKAFSDPERYARHCEAMKIAQSSEETNLKRSASLKKTKNDPKYKAHILERNKDPEIHRHRCEANRRWHADPMKYQHFKDAMSSEEHREKMSGENNGMFGKHWWTNGSNDICASECPGEGYVRGRCYKKEEQKEIKNDD